MKINESVQPSVTPLLYRNDRIRRLLRR